MFELERVLVGLGVEGLADRIRAYEVGEDQEAYLELRRVLTSSLPLYIPYSHLLHSLVFLFTLSLILSLPLGGVCVRVYVGVCVWCSVLENRFD